MTGRQWRTLLATAPIMAFTNVDYYGISIALSSIGREFKTSGVELEWVMNAYLLALAVPLIALGRVTDIVGARRMTLAGAALFVVAAFLSGLSPSIGFLIAGRMLLGLANAMLTVGPLALINGTFDDEEEGAGIGLLTAIGLAGGVVGPFLAGALTDAESWRYFYFAVAGVGAAGFMLVSLFAEKLRPEKVTTKIDIWGFLLISASLLLLVLGLQLVNVDGWLAPEVLGCIAASLLCLFAFCLVERRVAVPLVDLSMFRDPSFTGACIMLFLFSFPYGALLLYLALYLQHVLGYSALAAGAIYVALVLPTAVLSLASGRLLQLCGARLILTVSVALVTVGFVCFGFVSPAIGLGVIIMGLVLVGAGRGLSGTVPMAIGLGCVLKCHAGAASGVLKSVSTVAVPIGIATFGALFRTWENESLVHIFRLAGGSLDRQSKAEVFGILSGSEVMKAKLASIAPAIAERAEMVASEAFSHAFRNLMFLSIALSLAVPVCIYLVRREHKTSADAKPTRA